MSDDMSFCYDAEEKKCKRYDCERHPNNIQEQWIPHSYMRFYGTEFCVETKKMTREEAVKHGKEQLEILWGKNREFVKVANRSLEAWDKVLKDIKQYKADCDISATDGNCLTCNNITFGSIEGIINRNLKEVEE